MHSPVSARETRRARPERRESLKILNETALSCGCGLGPVASINRIKAGIQRQRLRDARRMRDAAPRGDTCCHPTSILVLECIVEEPLPVTVMAVTAAKNQW